MNKKEGVLLGIDIRLVRIDDRLIHGQVAIVWAKRLDIQRIIVVSDAVTKDNIRKILLQQAAPPGIKVNVITVAKMIEVYSNPLFDGVKVILLFTNPVEVSKVVKSGIHFPAVNIGAMGYTTGKKMVANTIAVDDADLEAFHYLNAQGTELEIRKVITDSKQNLMDVLKKAKV
ncbi:PTS system mannose-specific transporter subunit IIAB [Carnobacterium divergens DSM 20623]|uniref:PTS system mannose-specific transporter subunit IIAB n=1 Tax=Carnobacterium divergens DSM 20623 TaxID=1449336 RepID=A0A0R2HVP2_CARDV|nr:PTS system mannose-specific transporter subunit IIAB [Carnobacterium divergens DSM 20623]